jgi:hypothetical protein
MREYTVNRSRSSSKKLESERRSVDLYRAIRCIRSDVVGITSISYFIVNSGKQTERIEIRKEDSLRCLLYIRTFDERTLAEQSSELLRKLGSS